MKILGPIQFLNAFIRRHNYFVERGVLGMNSRNLNYIFRSNPRKLYPLADDKLITKKLAQKVEIATPELYGVIDFQTQVKHFEEHTKHHDTFVIKPAHGSGGNGILVITGKKDGDYIKGDGTPITKKVILRHLSNILSGLYSLGGQTDVAIIESLVRFDPLFEKITYMGVPDIRLLLFYGVPVMAMLRLPTKESDGKANLHRGGIGVGIYLENGITYGGVQKDDPIDHHPDTGNKIAGVQIPNWRDLLIMGSKLYDVAPLGYIGADFVFDRDKGPMLLEINARPGLAIQIANVRGLKKRLERVRADISQLKTSKDKVDYALHILAAYN